MTMQEMLETCAGSFTEDWNTVTCWGARSGPSYLDQFVPSVDRDGAFRLQHRTHAQRSAYMPDISINIGWGLDPDELWPDDDGRRLSNDFFDGFDDPDWAMNLCDFFYNGNLVERVAYAVVDGGRAILPFPNQDGLVSRWHHDWFRVLDNIGLYQSEYDGYFQRAGLRVV